MINTVTLDLDATRDALDRAADAIRRGVGHSDDKLWKDIKRRRRMEYRHAVADAVAELGDPKTAAALREIIALLEQVP